MCFFWGFVVLQETYVVEDCLFYGDMTEVASKFLSTSFVSGRTIYYQDTSYTNDVVMEWKFKDSVPSTFLIGFGDTNGTSTAWATMMYYHASNSLSLFVDNNNVNISNPSKTTSTVFKLTSSSLHSITAYMDNATKSTRSTNSSHPLRCRLDSFTSTPVTLDYLKIKAL